MHVTLRALGITGASFYLPEVKKNSDEFGTKVAN